MNLKNLSAAFIVLLVVVGTGKPASAATIVLAPVFGHEYQNSVQNPCIFSNQACEVAGFSVSLETPGNEQAYDAFATYTGSTLLAFMNGGSLKLGLDINEAGGKPTQTLSLFTMAINGVVVDTYTGFAHNVPAINNGNGWADYTLTNFSEFTAANLVTFHFKFADASPGTENVFLIAGAEGDPGGHAVTPVPEPASMLLLGTGLLAVARARRKKTK